MDAVTAEVADAMGAHGIRVLLFKGPVLERWLYTDGVERLYGDIDLLVAPRSFDRAEWLLGELGFRKVSDGWRDVEAHAHEHHWTRGPHTIDLHRGLWGLGSGAAAAWTALVEGAQPFDIGGSSVEIAAPSAQALIVVVHAVQHGHAGRWHDELKRAIATVDDATWRDAAQLAERIGALGPFTIGLGSVGAGTQLLARLGLDPLASPDAHLHAGGAVDMSIGFLRLAEASTLHERVAAVLTEVIPSAGFLRHKYPIARRGRLGLALAYLWRPVWLGFHAPAGWRAWRTARARARRR
jgi:hypothetical protein